ncbi:hypothetical protein VN1284_08210 [Helicobacter pylori]|nr:hypothetical protein VN1284_08210 [Helicobacter pylori]
MDFFDASGAVIGSAIGGMLVAYGAYTGVGMLASTAGGVAIAELSGVAATNATLAWMSGGVISLGGGLAAMALIGGVGAASVITILGVLSAKKMEKKLEDVKAYCCEVEEAITKTYGVIDNLLAVERVVKLFTKQITKCDALLFSLSQDAIATMKKHNYNHSLYSQEERDQLCVTVSNPHDFERFFESSHHRQRPKAPREDAKGFGDHERADG